MHFALTEDQVAVRGLFAEFCGREVPSSRVRDAEPLGFDPKLWQTLSQLGALSMAVPASQGGGDASSLDLVLAGQQLGRVLAPVPFAEAAAATLALAEAGVEAPFLDDVVLGALLPSVALAPVAAGGIARLVPAGAVADVLVAFVDQELVAHLRSTDAARPASPRNLGSAPLADWSTHDTSERIVLASGEPAAAAYQRLLTRWKILTAAALVGLAEEALAIGLRYVLERHAFGGLIARFQAIQHRLADLSVRIDGTELLVFEAAWALDGNVANVDALAEMAFLAASEIAQLASRESLQFHGGYGFAMEYDIQLYWRRARAWPLAIGSSRGTYQALAARLFDASAS